MANDINEKKTEINLNLIRISRFKKYMNQYYCKQNLEYLKKMIKMNLDSGKDGAESTENQQHRS